jgi:photosystem II stability/assembly factor-like uncharacterized protein
MNEDQAGRQVRSVFENELEPALAGFEARMRIAVERAPARKARSLWPVQLAAAVLALIAIAVLTVPRFFPIATHPQAPSLKVTPTPATPFLVGSLWDMQVTRTGVAWLFGGQVVYRSADQGAHWADVSPRGMTGQPLAAFALGNNQAWLAEPTGQQGQLGCNTYYGTLDAGTSWQKLGTTPIAGSGIHQMTFVDSTHGWLLISLGAATGSEAVSVWGTTDGGRSWSKRAQSPRPQTESAPGQLSSSCDKTGITFTTETAGWLTSGCAAGGPSIYRTLDGGHTWTFQPLQAPPGQTQENLGNSANAEPPVFLNQSFGLLPVVLALGSKNTPSLVVYATHDGGRTWIPSVPVTSGRLMAAVRPDYWVIEVSPSRIATTQDGRRYNFIPSDVDLSQTQQLTFANEQTGLALTVVSPSGGYELLRTTDGGAHWSAVSFGPEAAISAAGDSGLGAAGLFPNQPGRTQCVIHGGGPAPGIQVPGICATAASSDSTTGAWTVTFTESWDARQFHGQGDPSTGQLEHSWAYVVSGDGSVVLSGQSGNFPPQDVR